MAYTKYYNPALDDDVSTPITAAFSNHLETGIFDAAATADAAIADPGGQTEGDVLQISSGVPAWLPLSTGAGTSGTLASRPSAASASGQFYLATDQDVLYFSDGTSWHRVGNPAGATLMWYSGTAPTGWVAYDGTALPSSTGIYADLATHLGGTATPDTRGRMPVGLGTHADVNAIGDNDGLAVGSRRPQHKHTVGNDTPDHTHNYGGGAAGTSWGWGGGTASYALQNATSGASARHTHTVGPQTGSEPTDGPAWITFLLIAKL